MGPDFRERRAPIPEQRPEFIDCRVGGAMMEPQQQLLETADGAPDSWEMADLEESMKKLLAPRCDPGSSAREISSTESLVDALPTADAFESAESGDVDSFLFEALQGKDRLTILRLEQEVEKFMRNPKLLQLEFPPMPSSYLRLAAHRVVQHYNLQSSVVDCNIPEGTRIIARKTPQSVLPRIKLSDIPADKQSEEKLVQRVQQSFELKRRPMKGSKYSRESNGYNDPSSRTNPSKSVEERKEEYNRARARIFSNSDYLGNVNDDDNLILEGPEGPQVFLNGSHYVDKKIEQPCEMISSFDFNDGFSRSDSANRQKTKNRVAIFRDREKDRKDPDYDRNYDRYMQRFDPGFGVGQGPYGMQAAVYTPLVNYNTEFPQLGGSARPAEPPMPRPSLPVRGPWTGSSSGVVYGHVDPMTGSFNLGHVGPHMYMHPQQFTRPGPNLTYEQSQDRFPQSLSQSHLQLEGNFSQARRQ